jgi:branched-subunit amino acid aminotransferase/4-amino-4-deoxychorismate lyase
VAIYYVDGQFVPAEQAVIPVDDLAILRGIGVFDLLRTYNGKPYFLDAHIDRLEASAQKIGLTLPWSHDEIVRVVEDTLAKNDIPEANIRIVVTGGSSIDFMNPSGTPRLLVLVSPIPRLPDHWYTEGVKIISWEVERPIPGAKSIDYISASLALKKAAAEGAIEALYTRPQRPGLRVHHIQYICFHVDRQAGDARAGHPVRRNPQGGAGACPNDALSHRCPGYFPNLSCWLLMRSS